MPKIDCFGLATP